MRALTALLMIAGVFVGASPAYAWWTYAKWGMTVDDLRQAAAGKLEECRDRCRTSINGFRPTYVVRDVDAAGLKGDAWFAFDASGHLDWTVLTFDEDTAFSTIERALLGKYGAPIDRVRTSVKATTWRDTARGTTIRIVDFGGKLAGTFVEYRPTAKGL